MTSKERILDAVSHKENDRVAITFDAEPEVYRALYDHLGLHTKEHLFDRLHVDTWMILPGNWIYPGEEIHKQEKTSIWGYKTVVKEYPGGVYDEVCFNPLAEKNEIADIKAHKWPSVDTFDFSHFTKESELHSDRAIIGVFTWGTFFISTFVRGMENLMMDFALRRDYVDNLFKTISEISYATITRMLESAGDGIDIVYMADDYCSQDAPLFCPEDFQEFVVPYLRKLVDITHRYNKKFLLHVCGAVRPLLPMIIDAGVDILEPIQTSARGMEAHGLKKDFGSDICFYGGVDIQNILNKGKPQQVADEVKRLINILGKNGGYIIGPGHTYIQIDSPVENIMTMYETAYTKTC